MHISMIREPIRRHLSLRRIYVSGEVLDELVLDAALDGSLNVVADVLSRLRDAQMHRRGMLIFPLHSLGVLGAGLLQAARGRISFIDASAGLALAPQSNSVAGTLRFLDEARAALGIRKRLPVDLLHHWRRSRPTKWFERNPILVIRTTQIPGLSMYANENLLLSELRAATAQIALHGALQPSTDDRRGILFSTRIVNNWQTLDIRHYFALFDPGGHRRVLQGDCIPIHAARTAISELAELGLDLDPRYWNRNKVVGVQIRSAVAIVHAGYLRAISGLYSDSAASRTYRRLFDALGFFRRSFRSSDSDFMAIVCLSTAFELILTDSSRGVGPVLQRNSGALLRGARGVRSLQAAIVDLYEVRCGLVHAGLRGTPDLNVARRAFAMCFVRLAERIDQLPRNTPTPIGDMIDG